MTSTEKMSAINRCCEVYRPQSPAVKHLWEPLFFIRELIKEVMHHCSVMVGEFLSDGTFRSFV